MFLFYISPRGPVTQLLRDPSAFGISPGRGVIYIFAHSLDEPLWVPPLGVRFNNFFKSLDKMLEIVFNEREVSNG